MNTAIKSIHARQILDCKARPMLEVDVITEGGHLGRGAAPTGTSVGMYEAFVLRDNDPAEYHGMSVHKAEAVVREVLAPALTGMDVRDLAAIDRRLIALDGTTDKRKLGGNAIYSVSIACMRAAAASENVPLYRYLSGHPLRTIPLPTFNVINGGRNHGITQGFNEFILAPYKAGSVEEAVAIGVEVYQELRKVITTFQNGREPFLGGSYGWAAPSADPRRVLDLMADAAERCGCADKVAFCLDCASGEFYDVKSKTYELNDRRVDAQTLIAFAKKLSEDYPLIFIEDLLDENDWDNFAEAHRQITRTNLIGDDLIATNRARLERAFQMKAVDGFILKPNQVGTLTEALETHQYATGRGMLSIPSGRSGGAVGDIVADLSLGLETPISKNGAPKSGERLDKINSLLRAAGENPGSTLADFSGLIHF